MPDIKWLIELGASVPDILIFVMGFMFAFYVIIRDRQQAKKIELIFSKLSALREKTETEYKEMRSKYSQVDKLTFGIAIAIQKKTGIKLLKQSADGKGDHALNRDVE